jgi:hypothetical protein
VAIFASHWIEVEQVQGPPTDISECFRIVHEASQHAGATL